MLTKEEGLLLLQKEVTPALGCTEPVSVALATADAYNAIKGQIVSIKVKMNPNVFKNGMAVGIPGCPYVGLNYAAALGACLGNPEKGLQLFEDISDAVNNFADYIVKAGKIEIAIAKEEQNLYVHAEVITTNGIGITTIRDSHANIVFTKANDNVIVSRETQKSSDLELYDKLKNMKISQIKSLMDSFSTEELKPMLKGMEMNESIADYGLERRTGIGISEALKGLSDSSIFGSSLQSRIITRTAACAEARMSGCPYSIMSSAGSGNHGITAIIPVVELAAELDSPEDILAKALAFSHLITLYIKQYTGRLSAICGCAMCAASGAAAAMTWLLGGNDRQIEGAIINMAANITGMICDGGKVGCALKLATAANAAIISAYLAADNVIVAPSDGISAPTAEEVISNMGKISIQGMQEADQMILAIMLKKVQV